MTSNTVSTHVSPRSCLPADGTSTEERVSAEERGSGGGEGVQIRIVPWADPVVESAGYDPRGWYFERYWLGVIGPTATLVMRRFADCFDEQPDGFSLNLQHCAATMGLSFRNGLSSPFGRALQRCSMFGLARPVSDGLVVRRKAPQVARRHLVRLPDDVKSAHPEFAQRSGGSEAVRLQRQLSDALAEAGIPQPLSARVLDSLGHAV